MTREIVVRPKKDWWNTKPVLSTVGKSLHSFISKFKPGMATILTKDCLGERKMGTTYLKFMPPFYV